jgi:bifunctional non-homologous end joining protein LigD
MAGLETYRAKRHFGITAEPRGKVADGSRKALGFVIQRHAATKLHYDFRLELDGVYKSWAVTKVPSLDPATKRLAVEVEDHPLEYGTFEGTIPEGQYGGGTVQLWDRGTWKAQGGDPSAELEKGQLKITLLGERLRGGWALVRMRDKQVRPGHKARHNWLMIKERDEAALPGEPDALLAANTSITTGRTLEEIASGKTSRVWNSSRKAGVALKPAARTSGSGKPKTVAPKTGNVVAGVTISHPGKALWPATKTSDAVTKLDLGRFYEIAAPRILPHIEGRPISLVRAPDGIKGERFFQRHVLPGVAGAVPIQVAGEKQPYHAIDSVAGLVALGQAAVVEIHPWGCKPGDPETPERLIFDLDPGPDLGFDRVIEAAREMRDALTSLGLVPFVKTTGGKGIHVVTAIEGSRTKPVSWDEAKAFALALCERVAEAAPERYVTNMAKKHRGGKIFLDYLRNGRMATAVAAWSPRARVGATVAMPIPWKDLKKGLDPAAFTIANAHALLKRADAWKDLAASAGSLRTAKKKLTKL